MVRPVEVWFQIVEPPWNIIEPNPDRRQHGDYQSKNPFEFKFGSSRQQYGQWDVDNQILVVHLIGETDKDQKTGQRSLQRRDPAEPAQNRCRAQANDQ